MKFAVYITRWNTQRRWDDSLMDFKRVDDLIFHIGGFEGEPDEVVQYMVREFYRANGCNRIEVSFYGENNRRLGAKPDFRIAYSGENLPAFLMIEDFKENFKKWNGSHISNQ